MELHAAAEVLPEQHRAHLRGLHMHPPEAAGLCSWGPGQARVGAQQPPGHAGGIQEKVSLFPFHSTRGPRVSCVNNLGLSPPIYKKF